MSNLVIVAIPDENDRVWKVSSEKIPHLTLLFLGDADKIANSDQIVQFVEHAANTTLKRFYLPVDRRGELGDDQADVLFFKKNRYDYKAIRDFRVQLLKNDSIRTAYDSATQFEGPWTPHLTLGYPETPAKTEENDYGGFYNVDFNKIAVWFGDFDGPDFLLKDHWDEFEALETVPMDVAMSGIIHHGADEYDQTTAVGEAFMAHYGVKGMRWGVTRSHDGKDDGGKRAGVQRYLDPQGHDLGTDIAKTGVGILIPIVAPLTWPAQIRLIRGGIRGADAKLLDSQEKKFTKNAMSPKNFAAIHNGAIPRVNREIAEHSKKYPDLSKPGAEKKYDAAVLKSMQDAYRESANSLTNKSRTMHLDVEFKNDGQDFKIEAKQGKPTPLPTRVKHADEADEEVTVEITGKIKRDANRHIVGFEFDHLESASATHAQDLAVDFLEHYGVKGMRWGQRKAPPVAVNAMARSHVPHGTKRKTKLKVEGGENHPAHEDAIVVAEARAKLKKSGTAALSNAELQKMAKRLQLETQVVQLTSSRGQKFIMRQLEQTGQQQVQLGVRKGGAHVVKKGAKNARRAAAIGGVGLALL